MFFTETRFKKGRKLFENRVFTPVERQLQPINYFGDEIADIPVGDEFIFDVESYPNYFLIAFKHIITGKVVTFEDTPTKKFNRQKLSWLLWRFCIIGFNSIDYDMIVTWLAVNGMSCRELKTVTNEIIVEKMQLRDLAKKYKFFIPNINHIDIIEVAPLQASLKIYAGRLHCRRMQDLPFNPDKELTDEECEFTKHYCVNDLDNTELLYNELKKEIELRRAMGVEYGQELRSKSDAQLAQVVINSEIERITGKQPKRPVSWIGQKFKYEAPGYVGYQSPEMQKFLCDVLDAEIVVGETGHVICPPSIEGRTVTIGGNVYKIGMGGLHSQEKSRSYVATDDMLLLDDDVASYYPNLILTLEIYPDNTGPVFLTVFRTLVNRRLLAKKNKNMVEANSLKIVTNGTFGKLSDPYSTLYDPAKMVKVTLSGQLALLMLIERMEAAGIKVISANTDGIVKYCPKHLVETHEAIMRQWEKDTGLETEQTKYKAVYSRDVNNYIAITGKEKPEAKFFDEQLGVKVKGVYGERGSALNSILSKNPEVLICNDAVQAFLARGTPVHETIYDCKKIERFISIKTVKGGAHKDGVYLGKAVRWYYAEGETGCIQTVGSDSKVGKTDGAKPLLDLPDHFPNDISYDWYVNEANEMLFDLGYYKREKQLAFF